MKSVASIKPISSFKQTEMRAVLGQRFKLKNKLFDAMSVDATPIQWLGMAIDPNAFTGYCLDPDVIDIYRSIIFKHVAKALVADPSQPGLGAAMADAIKQPGCYAGLAFENFAGVLNASNLLPINDDAGKCNAMTLATAVMHCMKNASPRQKMLGLTLRDKLDAQLAAYVAPPLPLILSASSVTMSCTSMTRLKRRIRTPRL